MDDVVAALALGESLELGERAGRARGVDAELALALLHRQIDFVALDVHPDDLDAIRRDAPDRVRLTHRACAIWRLELRLHRVGERAEVCVALLLVDEQ